MITRWSGSKTWEAWDLPLETTGTTGKSHMQQGTYALKAKIINVVDVGTVYIRSDQAKQDFLHCFPFRKGIYPYRGRYRERITRWGKRAEDHGDTFLNQGPGTGQSFTK